MITGTVIVFIPRIFSISILRSLYFVSFSIVFKEVFLSVGINISISRQVLSFFLVFHHYVWSVCFYLFASLDWHVPEYSHCLVFCHINWFMFVVFILYFDVIVFADCPVEICCSFIVSLYVLCLGKFRASRDKVVNCFLKLPTISAHWVGAIFSIYLYSYFMWMIRPRSCHI